MSKRWDAQRDVAARLASERGTIFREAETRIALCYPSPYRAAMSSLGRIGETEDIARVVLFLASEEAAWVTGQNIGVNGGVA